MQNKIHPKNKGKNLRTNKRLNTKTKTLQNKGMKKAVFILL